MTLMDKFKLIKRGDTIGPSDRVFQTTAEVILADYETGEFLCLVAHQDDKRRSYILDMPLRKQMRVLTYAELTDFYIS